MNSGLCTTFLVRSPQCQVVTEQLHDESRVFVGVLSYVVKLRNRIFEGGACHLASFFWVVKHFVLEDGEVEGKAKTDWMRHCQILLRNLLSFLICQFGIVGSRGLLVAIGELCDVTVVIGLHLLVEDLTLTVARFGDGTAIQQAQDSVTNLVKLTLHLAAIFFCEASIS